MTRHRFQILGSNPERVRVVTPAKKSDKLKDIAARLSLPTHPLDDVMEKFAAWEARRVSHPTMTIYSFDEDKAALVRVFFQ